MKLGVVVNPAAGSGRAGRAAEIVLPLLRDAHHDVVDLTAPDATSARLRAAALLQEGDVDALIAVGGDGVVNLAANALLTHAPSTPLGIIPAGTGNDIARMFDLPLRDVPAATTRVLADLVDGRRRRIDAIRVSPGEQLDPERHRWFLNVVSAGFDAAVNARADHLRWPRGQARYVVALLRELRAFRGYALEAVLDGQVLQDCGTLATVSNGRYIGGGMKIAPPALLDDALLDVIVAPTVSRSLLLRIFPRVYRGTHTEHPLVSHHTAREVVLRAQADPAGRAPAPLAHGDGEPLGHLPIHLELVPAALTVLG